MDLNVKNIENWDIVDIRLEKPCLSEYIQISRELNRLVSNKNRYIVINLKQVAVFENLFIEMLLSAKKSCEKTNCNVSVCGMNQDILCIFYLLRLDKYFEFYEDEYDALLRKNRLVKRKLRVV